VHVAVAPVLLNPFEGAFECRLFAFQHLGKIARIEHQCAAYSDKDVVLTARFKDQLDFSRKPMGWDAVSIAASLFRKMKCRIPCSIRLQVGKICTSWEKQMYSKSGIDGYKADLIFAHYGIDIETRQVRIVWQRRDGMLWMGSYGHLVMPGRPIGN
jgi:hypothetical protein